MDQQKMIELANTLSNKDVCHLLNALGDRIHIYFGSLNNYMLDSEFEHACLNGCSIQINTKSSQLDNLAELEFLSEAINNGKSSKTAKGA